MSERSEQMDLRYGIRTRDKEGVVKAKIYFIVRGVPATAGSKRAFPLRKGGVLTGRSIIVDSSGAKGKAWRTYIQDAARAAHKSGELLTGPIKLECRFWFSRPKGHYGTGSHSTLLKASAPLSHLHKPDLTKLLRAVEDALKGIVWRDDSQITCQHTVKGYTHDPRMAGVEVTITEG